MPSPPRPSTPCSTSSTPASASSTGPSNGRGASSRPGISVTSRIPHVIVANQVARVARLKVRRELERGQIDAAFRDLSRLMRLSRDLLPRGVPIAGMVSASIDGLAVADIILPMLAAPGLTVAHCDQILALLDRARGSIGRRLHRRHAGRLPLRPRHAPRPRLRARSAPQGMGDVRHPRRPIDRRRDRRADLLRPRRQRTIAPPEHRPADQRARRADVIAEEHPGPRRPHRPDVSRGAGDAGREAQRALSRIAIRGRRQRRRANPPIDPAAAVDGRPGRPHAGHSRACCGAITPFTQSVARSKAMTRTRGGPGRGPSLAARPRREPAAVAGRGRQGSRPAVRAGRPLRRPADPLRGRRRPADGLRHRAGRPRRRRTDRQHPDARFGRRAPASAGSVTQSRGCVPPMRSDTML